MRSIGIGALYSISYIKLELTPYRLRSFVRSFVRSSIRSFVRPSTRSFDFVRSSRYGKTILHAIV